MAVVIVVNPVYIRQDPWTTSCCSPVELTCRRRVKGAIPRGRVRFPPVTWVLSNCQRSFLQRVLQLQRPWVILPMCTWRPSERSQLSQAHAGREDVVSSMGLCLQTRGGWKREAGACREHLLVLHPHLDGEARAPAPHLFGGLLWANCSRSHEG